MRGLPCRPQRCTVQIREIWRSCLRCDCACVQRPSGQQLRCARGSSRFGQLAALGITQTLRSSKVSTFNGCVVNRPLQWQRSCTDAILPAERKVCTVQASFAASVIVSLPQWATSMDFAPARCILIFVLAARKGKVRLAVVTSNQSDLRAHKLL